MAHSNGLEVCHALWRARYLARAARHSLRRPSIRSPLTMPWKRYGIPSMSMAKPISAPLSEASRNGTDLPPISAVPLISWYFCWMVTVNLCEPSIVQRPSTRAGHDPQIDRAADDALAVIGLPVAHVEGVGDDAGAGPHVAQHLRPQLDD